MKRLYPAGIVFLCLLIALCCLSALPESAAADSDGLAEIAGQLRNTETVDEQLQLLSDCAAQYPGELETTGWNYSLTCGPADTLPKDLVFTAEALADMDHEEMTTDDLTGAKIICLYNDQGTIKLLGDFQVRIPEDMRAVSLEEADTIAYLVEDFTAAKNYIGSAYHRYYYFYILRLEDQRCCCVWYDHTSPPAYGKGTLTGEEIGLSEIWTHIRPWFFGTIGISLPEGNAVYRITGDSCCLAGLEGGFIRYEIPEAVEGYPVTGIENCQNDTLTELVLSEGITWIQSVSCPNLRSMNFPSTLRQITGKIPEGIEDVQLNEGLEEISGGALAYPHGRDFRLPSTLRVIGEDSIMGAECTYIVIPEGVTMLHSGFLWEREGNTRVLSVFVPSSVKTLENSAIFYNNIRIYTPEDSATARWAEKNGRLWVACESPEDMPIPYYGMENGFEYGVVDGEAVLTGYSGTADDVRIPETLGGFPVTTINPYTFHNNNAIRSLVFPQSAVRINDDAIISCFGLKDIYMPLGTKGISSMFPYYVSADYTIYVPAGETAWDYVRCAEWVPGMEETEPEEPYAWDTDQQEALKTVGATVIFGRWEQNGNEADGPEALEWIVLAVEEDRSLLVTRSALGTERFDDSTNGPTWMDWGGSSIRRMLQKDYYDRMFSKPEREIILSTKNEYGPEKIFLLSAEEAGLFGSDEARSCTVIREGTEEPVSWWLRSKGTREDNYLAYVWGNGMIDTDGQIYKGTEWIRPAIWVPTK